MIILFGFVGTWHLMSSPFSRFPPAPVDPIFAVAQEAKAAGEWVIFPCECFVCYA